MGTVAERQPIGRILRACPTCGEELGLNWGGPGLACLNLACTYTEPLPPDLALRLMRARELPGLRPRAG